MDMKKLLLLSLIALLMLSQCREKTLEGEDMGYSFFPTTSGQYVTYDVDSIVWDVLNNSIPDTFEFQVKLRVEDEYKDEAGRKVHRWVKYTRTDTTQWKVDEVWGAIVEPSYLEVNENNLPLVRLSFPTRLGNKWDMNAFNTQRESKSTLIELDESIQLNGLQIDSTCTVLIVEDDQGYIEDNYVYDKFARNIGLVERYVRYLETTFQGDIKEGSITHYQIKGFGIEQIDN